jgi:hypothetical protein
MLRVDHARWDQTPADLRELAMSASHPRTRERFLALYEITQESCATRVAAQARRHVTVHLPLGDGKSLLSNDDSGYELFK